MNDIKNFLININEIRSYKEGRRGIKLKPLLLLQDFNLFFRGYFLIHILGIFFIEFFSHFVTHLLKFEFNLLSFLFYHVLKFFIIIGFFSEFDSNKRVTIKLKKLESKLDIHTNMP